MTENEYILITNLGRLQAINSSLNCVFFDNVIDQRKLGEARKILYNLEMDLHNKVPDLEESLIS